MPFAVVDDDTLDVGATPKVTLDVVGADSVVTVGFGRGNRFAIIFVVVEQHSTNVVEVFVVDERQGRTGRHNG